MKHSERMHLGFALITLLSLASIFITIYMTHISIVRHQNATSLSLYESVFTHAEMSKTNTSELYGTYPSTTNSSYHSHPELGVYWWVLPRGDSHEFINEDLDILQKMGFTSIYLDISDYIDAYESGDNTQIETFTARITQFIEKADQKNLSVIAVVGNPTWSEKTFRYIPLTILSFVTTYNKDRENNSHFSGIHFDIEPYSLPRFTKENESIVLYEYLATVIDIINRHTSSDPTLPLSFAIPYWLSHETRELPLVTYENKKGPLGYQLLEALDKIPHGKLIIMDYRDKAEGENGSIELARPYFNYIKKQNLNNVSVSLAQETTDINPRHATFYGHKEASLREELQKLENEFGGEHPFSGFVIHDSNGYLSLLRN